MVSIVVADPSLTLTGNVSLHKPLKVFKLQFPHLFNHLELVEGY